MMLCMAMTCMLAAGPLPTADELAQKLIRNRSALGSGEVEFVWKQSGHWFGRPVDTVETYAILVDGAKLRFECSSENDMLESPAPRRIIKTPEQSIRFSRWDSQVEGPFVRIASANLSDSKARLVFRPELMGCFLATPETLCSSTLEEMLRRNDILESNVVEEKMGGENVIKSHMICGNNGNRLELEIWYLPDKDYSIRKSMVRYQVGEKAYEGILEATYQQVPTNGRWFLLRSEGVATLARAEMYRQSIEIKKAIFGVRPDPSRFSLASLNIPTGTQVHEDDRILVWDGSSLQYAALPEAMPESTAAWYASPRVWVGALSLSLGIMLVVRYFASRSERHRT